MITWEDVKNAERDARELALVVMLPPAEQELPLGEIFRQAEPEESAAEARARMTAAERVADDRWLQQRRRPSPGRVARARRVRRQQGRIARQQRAGR